MWITIYIDGLRILWEKNRASCSNSKTDWLQLLQYKTPQKPLGTNPLAKVHPTVGVQKHSSLQTWHCGHPGNQMLWETFWTSDSLTLLPVRENYTGLQTNLHFWGFSTEVWRQLVRPIWLVTWKESNLCAVYARHVRILSKDSHSASYTGEEYVQKSTMMENPALECFLLLMAWMRNAPCRLLHFNTWFLEI